MLIHLPVIYGCFHAMTAELSSYIRDYMAHKAENAYYLALFRKCLLTSEIKSYFSGKNVLTAWLRVSGKESSFLQEEQDTA